MREQCRMDYRALRGQWLDGSVRLTIATNTSPSGSHRHCRHRGRSLHHRARWVTAVSGGWCRPTAENPHDDPLTIAGEPFALSQEGGGCQAMLKPTYYNT